MTATFSVIGHPFPFTWATAQYGSNEKVLRVFCESPDERDGQRYELFYRKRDDVEELYEDGWYLTGVGHHLVWCAATVEDAVDAAQEHILWDGQDPHSLPMEGPRNEHRPHAMRVADSEWLDDDIWFGMFSGKVVRNGQAPENLA